MPSFRKVVSDVEYSVHSPGRKMDPPSAPPVANDAPEPSNEGGGDASRADDGSARVGANAAAGSDNDGEGKKEGARQPALAAAEGAGEEQGNAVNVEILIDGSSSEGGGNDNNNAGKPSKPAAEGPPAGGSGGGGSKGVRDDKDVEDVSLAVLGKRKRHADGDDDEDVPLAVLEKSKRRLEEEKARAKSPEGDDSETAGDDERQPPRKRPRRGQAAAGEEVIEVDEGDDDGMDDVSAEEEGSGDEDSVDRQEHPPTERPRRRGRPQKDSVDPREQEMVAEIVRRYTRARTNLPEEHQRLPKGTIEKIVAETRRDLDMEDNNLSMGKIRSRINWHFSLKPKLASKSGQAGAGDVDDEVIDVNDDDDDDQGSLEEEKKALDDPKPRAKICDQCGASKGKESFPSHSWNNAKEKGKELVCCFCIDQKSRLDGVGKVCDRCKVSKGKKSFPNNAWYYAKDNGKELICYDCRSGWRSRSSSIGSTTEEAGPLANGVVNGSAGENIGTRSGRSDGSSGGAKPYCNTTTTNGSLPAMGGGAAAVATSAIAPSISPSLMPLEAGVVLPWEETVALQKEILDLAVRWASKEGYRNWTSIMSEKYINIVALFVPTTEAELHTFGLPPAFCAKYGHELIVNVKAYLLVKNCQQLVDRIKPQVIDKMVANGTSVDTVLLNSTGAKRGQRTSAGPHVPNAQRILANRMLSNQEGNGQRMNGGAGKTAPNATGHVSNTSTASKPNQRQNERGANNTAVLERFSEYRIDNANSIDELESIRRRLLTLLGRVDARLKEERLIKALTEAGQAVTEDVQNLSTEELIKRLSEELDGSSSSNKEISSKRKANDASKSTDCSGEKERHCLSTACPLCFKTAESSSSAGTCVICEETGICSDCHSKCPRCRRLTCDDCIMSCKGCGYAFHCADCMIGGKCFVCRSREQAAAKKQSAGVPKFAPTRQQNGVVVRHPQNGALHLSSKNNNLQSVSRLARTNQVVGPPQNYPPLVAQPMPAVALPAQQQQRVAPPLPLTNPLPSRAQTVNNPEKLAASSREPRFSIHRFIVSESGIVGLNISQLGDSGMAFVSKVHPNSAAWELGVQENDEIVPPFPLPQGSTTYDLFLSAAKSRPFMFEVRRKYDSPPDYSSVSGHHSLHRFVISKQGSLGLNLSKKGATSTTKVTNVAPNSLADVYGLCENDILCKPGTDGRELHDMNTFVSLARSETRPLTIEVLRPWPASGARREPSKLWQRDNEDSFSFSFPMQDESASANAETKGKDADKTNGKKQAATEGSKEPAAESNEEATKNDSVINGTHQDKGKDEKEVISIDDSDEDA